MTIDLQEFPKYAAAATEMAAKIAEGAGIEEQKELFASTFQVLGDELNEMASSQLKKMFDTRAKNQQLTANEIAFFNEIDKNVGTKNPILLPEETIEQVFEDLKVEHPLLSIINFKNTKLRLKTLTAETSGLAVWGKIHDKIKGQLNHAFKEQDFSQFKLTAFVVIPKDALKFGAAWLKTFVSEQIKEAMAVALETAIVSGDGLLKPVGLMKDLSQKTVDQTTGSDVVVFKTDKEAMADISALTPENAPSKLAPVLKYLSINEKDHPINIDGKVKLLVNPSDKWTLLAQFTQLNAQGTYITTLPFGVSIIESLAMPKGKGIAFVADRYDAFMASSAEIEEFDQVLAMEDMQLYITKGYFYGKAKDNKVAAVVTLAGG